MSITYNNYHYHLTKIPQVKPVLQGIDAWVNRQIGKIKSGKFPLKKIELIADKVLTLSSKHHKLNDADLVAELEILKSFFKAKPYIDFKKIEIENKTIEALALISEAVYRNMGYRPYKVQIMGALAMFKGYVIEMSTGEGKTITCAMAAIIRGWTHLPTYVITSNDYLAQRDAEDLKPLFNYCHNSVDFVVADLEPQDRKRAYEAAVVYSTAKEILADFLRDRLAMGKMQKTQPRLIHSLFDEPKGMDSITQRGIHTAIVDEADNVLIDEAVTPLIISRQSPNKAFEESCIAAYKWAMILKPDIDYKLAHKHKDIDFLKPMNELYDTLLSTKKDLGDYGNLKFLSNLLRQAIVAREYFIKDQQYVIEEEKVVIVDERTGRKMPMRSWSGGLHQMVEIKEGLEISPLNETHARMSFQRFFRLFNQFSGMTGTAKEALPEFWHLYNCPVLPIPNHRPSKRIIYPVKVFKTSAQKWNAIHAEILKIHLKSRPLLIGTKDVNQSEKLNFDLAKLGLNVKIVNAVRAQEEADIIKSAGQASAITVATNMAGRGTDIHISKEVNELGGLHVIACELASSPRIDRQLFGRSARQGDQGSAISFVCLSDELILNHSYKWMQKLCAIALDFNLQFIGRLLISYSQYKAQKQDFKSRIQVQKMDKWLDESLSFAGENS